MKRRIKKLDAGPDGRRSTGAVMTAAPLSARDPLAYAAALHILG